MKVLSIRQPYAWLIFNGGKSIENRSWATNYTGPLLIHAGKALYPDAERIREWWNTLAATSMNGSCPRMPALDELPKGAIAGKADLVACRWMNCETAHRIPWATGPCCWYLRDKRPLPPFPVRGMQGLFSLREALPDGYLELAA